MRIAVLNAWPNLEYAAEREFIARFKLACLNLGWECIETITSDDILNADVDCVIATHEYSPKLTHVPTIGLLWNPPDFYCDDPLRIKNILSYDGYLTGSESVREYLGDLLFSTRKNSPISEWDFLPTAQKIEFKSPDLSNPQLFYAGVHWDGRRHEKLIKGLHANLPVSFYGDPTKWARFGSAYKGVIPFDGLSIFDRINAAGVALCLHRDEHLKHGVPSMRIFESAAASAVIITENSNFTKRFFAESVLYLDQDASDAEKERQITTHFKWIRSHPDEAQALAAQANAVFNEHYSLEKLLSLLPEFLDKVKSAGCYIESKVCKDSPQVEAIVRIGGRGLDFIERSLDSLAAQYHTNLGLILVNYLEVPGLDALLEKYKARFASIKRISSTPTGFRSTALWDGLRAVEGDLFCNLDDDDTIHPNHISSLVDLLATCKDYNVVYSGCIQVQDERGHFYQQVNFKGPNDRQIEENRQLLFFEPFKRKRMLQLENFVVSNAWLARKSVLKDGIFEDPKLIVAEDVYLYHLLLRHGDFLFSWRATANWHWRSTSKDNSMLLETCQAECGKRVMLRTQYFDLSQDSLTCEDVVRPFVSYAWKKFPRIKMLVRSIRKWF